MRKSHIALLIVTSCALGGTVAGLQTALATGAAPAPPTVASAPATGIGDAAVTLNGTVNPNGLATSYAIQWGPTTGYGHETAIASAGSGTVAVPVHADVNGLQPGSAYHFRVIAISSAGTAVGADESFSTTGTAPASSPAPRATTTPASQVGQDGATLNGTDNPNGQTTSYYFEYGPTSNYGYQTAPQSAGSGTTDQPAAATISGLPAATTYHYRLVAISAGGTALGADATFTTTTPPSVSTGSAAVTGTTRALVNGTVDPHGVATTYDFEYGTTASYGLQTVPASAGSGNGNVAVHATLSGLTANGTYHYRLVAQSAGGTTYGADQIVSLTQSTSQVRFLGRMGFVSPGRVIGVEAGCFGGASRCIGHVTMSHDGTLIGQRDFDIAPNSGGFQNLQISSYGESLLGQNRVFHLLPVTVTVTTTSGQKTSQVMTLARWVWR